MAQTTGVVINRKRELTHGAGLVNGNPNQFKSTHSPVKISGTWFCAAIMPPKGPSFEKTMLPGKKALKKRMNKIKARTAAQSRKCLNADGELDWPEFIGGATQCQGWRTGFQQKGSKGRFEFQKGLPHVTIAEIVSRGQTARVLAKTLDERTAE